MLKRRASLAPRGKLLAFRGESLAPRGELSEAQLIIDSGNLPVKLKRSPSRAP